MQDELLAAESSANYVEFLGISDKFLQFSNSTPAFPIHNIIGLRKIVIALFFPLSLEENQLVISVHPSAIRLLRSIEILDGLTKVLATFSFSTRQFDPSDEGITRSEPALSLGQGSSIVGVPFPKDFLVLEETEEFFVQANFGDTARVIGSFSVGLAQTQPLDAQTIQALRSRPDTQKLVFAEIGCKHCDTKLKLYAGLEKDQSAEEKGFIWYQYSPDRFVCGCESTNINCASIRSNLHMALTKDVRQISPVAEIEPLYRLTALQQIRREYERLLNKRDIAEQDVHLFLDKNPLLLHQFTARRIFSKPPIANKYVADFAIFTVRGELILVEIEKPTTRLLKKDGGQAGELTHAIDQVRSWLHEIDMHRVAFMDSLNLDYREVGSLRGFVIAGRHKGNDAANLRRLLSGEIGRVSLLTFDDLLFSLENLIERIKAI